MSGAKKTTKWRVEGKGVQAKIFAYCSPCKTPLSMGGDDPMKIARTKFTHGDLCNGRDEEIPSGIREKYLRAARSQA
ncbi:MAG: hypothetical protein ABR953_10390 [Candidatus Acidiferrales bacterium]|jgi:hypothetical protein